MKLEPQKIAGVLPRDHELDWLPTEPPIDERPFADSTTELARGLDVVELAVDDAQSTLTDQATIDVWQPMTADEQAARALGIQARRAGALPDASPYEPGTLLDLCWMDGFRTEPAKT